MKPEFKFTFKVNTKLDTKSNFEFQDVNRNSIEKWLSKIQMKINTRFGFENEIKNEKWFLKVKAEMKIYFKFGFKNEIKNDFECKSWNENLFQIWIENEIKNGSWK